VGVEVDQRRITDIPVVLAGLAAVAMQNILQVMLMETALLIRVAVVVVFLQTIKLLELAAQV
jgi:hypothetical protein